MRHDINHKNNEDVCRIYNYNNMKEIGKNEREIGKKTQITHSLHAV